MPGDILITANIGSIKYCNKEWFTVGEAMIPVDEGIWDNYCVKKQLLHSW